MMSNWLSSLELTLAALSTYFSPEAISETSDRVLWTGSLGWRSSALELRTTPTSAALHAPQSSLPLGALQVRDFEVGACSVADRGALLVTGKRDARPVALWIESDALGRPEIVRERALPAAPVGRPVCTSHQSELAFALLLEDRSVLWLQRAVMHATPDVIAPPRDLSEYPWGVFTAATLDETVVVSVERELIAVRADGARDAQTLERAWVAPGVASSSADMLFALDSAGALLSYAPFHSAPRVLFPAPGSTPGGLSVWSDASGVDSGMVWGDRAGAVRWFDGTSVRELVRWQAGIRWPILAFDAIDSGSTQLVMALDDGSLGLVAGDREHTAFLAASYPIAVRTSGPLRLSDQSDLLAASLRLPSGSQDRTLSLASLHAAPILRDAASVQPGEMLVGRSSTAARTRMQVDTADPPTPDAASAPDQGSAAGQPDAGAGVFSRGLPYRMRSLLRIDEPPAANGGSGSSSARSGCAVSGPLRKTDPGSSLAWTILLSLVTWRVRARRERACVSSAARTSRASDTASCAQCPEASPSP